MSNINLRNVSLDYPVYGSGPRLFSKKMLSLASAGIIKHNDSYNYVRALDNINIELKAGDRLGLIGGNGAGKTTLLKIIAGIYSPTFGTRKVIGRITTLLGTGFGLDEEATGYDNIILGGITLGYGRKEMKTRFEDIEEFTELGDFLNMPIKIYSAGMKARLAFAIATCIEPEILIIDEGIGTADAQFQEKAQKRIKSFLSKAAILVLASHSNDLLLHNCNKGLHMSKGKALFLGGTKAAIKHRMGLV